MNFPWILDSFPWIFDFFGNPSCFLLGFYGVPGLGARLAWGFEGEGMLPRSAQGF